MALIDFFDRGMSLGADRVAFVADDKTWTFQQAFDVNSRVAHALIDAGFAKETRAAVLAMNDPLAWQCVLGLWRAGLAWVPLNPRSTVEDHVQLLGGFDAEVIFYQRAFASDIAVIRAQCPAIRLFVCLDGDDAPSHILTGWIKPFPATFTTRQVDPDDLGAIMPTGGTTGMPKGVMLTHRTLCLSTANGIINSPYPADEPIVNLAAAPMTHTAGFLSLSATARGGTIIIMTRPDPASLLDMMEKHRVTELFLPPTVIYRLLEMPGVRDRKLPGLRYFNYGAAPMSIDKLRLALDIFGPVMHQGYGQTEAPGSIAFMRPGHHYRDGQIADDNRLSACGLPSVLNATAIMDEDNRPVPQGESGEICVRGDIVMKGYYRQPEKTAEVIIDGWLHTGDIGHLDGEGFLHITDRKKDMIISGGFNVFPSEVEQVIWSHPAVMDCAVIGVPHPDWGETVKAVVELKPGAQATAEGLIALCKDKLGSVKAPKSVDFIESLPRSPVGKVLKKVIREPYWKDVGRRI
ncbi:MAG: long-chain fatty-acid-CoA ligase [Pseudomonadota bacterium]